MSQAYSEICYVVHDLEQTLDKWIKRTGAGPFYISTSDPLRDRVYRGAPAEDSVIGALGFMGTTLMEFIQPTNDKPSIFREILDAKGEAVHHIYPSIRALTPADYDAEFARYVGAGLEPALVMNVPGIGRNAFFDGLADFGCFFELLELQNGTFGMVEQMYQTHLHWDGRNPMRKFFEIDF